MSDKWDEHAAKYAEWATRQTLPYALASLALVDAVSPSQPARALDVATGDGAFVVAAAKRWQTTSFVALDYSARMIMLLNNRIAAERLTNIQTITADAQVLHFPDSHFDFVSVIFGLFLMQDGSKCLKEIHRVLKPGGRLVFTSWANTFLSDLLLAALLVVNPAAAMARLLSKCSTEPKTGTWNNHDWIRAECASFSSTDIRVVSHPVLVHASERNSFVEMLSSGPGIQYLMRAEGWSEHDSLRVSEGLTVAMEKLFEGGKESVELVSSASIVVCVK